MGLPWIQVAKEFPRSQEAIELAAELGLPRPHAVGLALEFWGWALDAAPDGMVRGGIERATLKIDTAAGHIGFAVAMLAVGLLEETADGLRICGWDRYAKALEKHARDAERKRGRRADVQRTARGRPADGAGEMEIEIKSQILPPSEVVASRPPPLKLEEQAAGDKPPKKRSEGQLFRDWAEDERTRVLGLVRGAEPPPAQLNRWFTAVIAEVGIERLKRGWARYLLKPRDDYWRARDFPFQGFMSDAVWRQYVPPEERAA